MPPAPTGCPLAQKRNSVGRAAAGRPAHGKTTAPTTLLLGTSFLPLVLPLSCRVAVLLAPA
eukprot:10378509-Lingulodinium_polyedra.AAC.1